MELFFEETERGWNCWSKHSNPAHVYWGEFKTQHQATKAIAHAVEIAAKKFRATAEEKAARYNAQADADALAAHEFACGC